MRTKRTVSLLLLAAALAAACTGRKTFDHYEPLPVAGWEKNDTLVFAVPPTADGGLYSLTLGLRTTGDYPFMSLTLVVEQERVATDTAAASPVARPHRVDTLTCRLTDNRGHAQGQGISYYQYDFPVGKLRMQAGDSLRVSVRHNMKREILPGLSDLGLRVYKE